MTQPDVKINEATYTLQDGKQAKIAVFLYSGTQNPKTILDKAIADYVGNQTFHELIDANLDNPWMRVILSNINDMQQEPFDSDKHHLSQSA